MRKKTYSKINGDHIVILFILVLLLFICIANWTAVSVQGKKLEIYMDNTVVHVNEQFSVQVVDNETKKGVEGVAVSIQGPSTYLAYSNRNGNAFLTAPSEPGECLIVATMEGYDGKGELVIKVIPSPAFWESPFFPIIVATICLISAIVYVSIRQKKDIYKRTKEISKEKLMKIQENTGKITSSRSDKKKETRLETKFETKPYEPKPIRAKTTKDAKVEEIRISRPRKQKEVIPVETKKDETEKVISEKRVKRRDYDWFEGKDDVRYEIDKLTGEIDEEGIDKWFEGVDDLRNKIDEKMKKKDKKNKEEKEE